MAMDSVWKKAFDLLATEVDLSKGLWEDGHARTSAVELIQRVLDGTGDEVGDEGAESIADYLERQHRVPRDAAEQVALVYDILDQDRTYPRDSCWASDIVDRLRDAH